MIVMGIDPSLRNTGWQVIKVQMEGLDSPYGTTHHLNSYVAGGTLKQENASIEEHIRLLYTTMEFYQIVQKFSPDVIVFESAIDVGRNKSITGFCLHTLMVAPWVNPVFEKLVGWNPHWIVNIRPERLQSLAHEERSTSGTKVVKKYKELTAGRGSSVPVTHHEADAFFLAYFGSRFVLTCLTKVWPQNILTKNEKRIYLEATSYDKRRKITKTTAMVNLVDTAWWEVPGATIEEIPEDSSQEKQATI